MLSSAGLYAETKRPSLIVIIAADQIRADYMERYHSDLCSDGLRRFRDQGIYFTQARMDHAVTKTSPGHVLYGSGIYAAQSGIVANEWFDTRSNTVVSAAQLIPGRPRVQLKWFVGTSLAQRVHRVFPKSRFISLSLKDRGSLLLGGPDQDDAYWWDLKLKKYVGYHASAAWLDDFNNALPSFLTEHTTWTQLVNPSMEYAKQIEAVHERIKNYISDDAGIGLTFPHPIANVDALQITPYSDELSEKLAEQVVDHFHVGHNPSGAPDVLTVSFSAVDLVGHEFGPDSFEVRDAFLRLDRMVAQLMDNLTRKVGPNIVWSFSSDHGVTPLPELSVARHQPGGRVRFTVASLPDKNGIKATSSPFIYLSDPAVQADLKKRLETREGISAVYTSAQLRAGKAPSAILHSYYKPAPGAPERCGDLFVVLKPGYIFSDNNFGTTHGQPTDDDQRVPLGFYGAGIAPRVADDSVSVAVAAPSLLKLLEIDAPDLAPAVSLR